MPQRKKKGLARNPQAHSESVDVAVKVGILHTIADTIYASTTRKIREAVANAKDNNASSMIILADPEQRTISIYDNGNGITRERFKEIFDSLGYGLLKREPGKLSYFGLGLMSIFQLGNKVRLFTRPVGQSTGNILEVDTAQIFDTSNEDKPIAKLKDFVRLFHDADIDVARAASPAPLLDEHIKEHFGRKPESFTEIVIEDAKQEDIDALGKADFETDLRKLLPLRHKADEPFLSCFKDRKVSKDLRTILDDQRYCPTIDVFFGVKDVSPVHRLWKYFPEFKKGLEFTAADVKIGVSKEETFAYYVVHTTEDLERSDKEGKETGFWVRNGNFLVKGADYFEQPGSRKKYINEPLKNWIFAEIFHSNMSSFLSAPRDDYLWDKKEFVEFRSGVVSIVENLNQELRKCWEQKKVIYDALITPFLNLEGKNGPLHNAEGTLRSMLQETKKDDQQFREEMFERLADSRKPEIEKPDSSIDQLLASAKSPIVIGEEANAVILIDPGVDEHERHRASWDGDKKRVKICISPKLFAPRQVVFLGKTFDVIFVAEKSSSPGVSVDTKGGKIYVNPFNHDITRYNLSFLDVYIALEIADAMAHNKKELKDYALRLLGREATGIKYMTGLADDLMRRRRAR